MRIGIDIRSLQDDCRYRGIGTYTRCLVKKLLSLDRDNEYVFFVFKDVPTLTLLEEGNFKNIKLRKFIHRRKHFGWFKGQAILPNIINKEKLDIFYSLEHMVPIFSSVKKVITIHDFIYNDYQIYKRKENPFKKLYFSLRDQTLKSADKITAVSEYTKTKIIELLGIREDRIKVIYEAADEIFRPINDDESFLKIKQKYNLGNDFILYVGAIAPHKNIDGLIRAFSKIRFKEVSLILAGPQIRDNFSYLTSINKLIEKLNIEDRVRILGYIPQEDLISLYNMARVFISVSFYEGFGLPILEAMACGRPAIAAKNTSMKEIVDSSGILVDPYNIEEIAFAIDRLLCDNGLRNSLSAKALARAKGFSWEKAAFETLSLCKELLN